ncbi:MAG TPA: hypothetical protein DHU96_33450 [Actinobacteria bacterium]|nr:hypothetical protein [Actinomycetota bacterium]
MIHHQQVVRAYDHQGRIADGILADNGDHALAVVRQMLARQDITLVHLRNVGYGCYNCLVRRVREVSFIGFGFPTRRHSGLCARLVALRG